MEQILFVGKKGLEGYTNTWLNRKRIGVENAYVLNIDNRLNIEDIFKFGDKLSVYITDIELTYQQAYDLNKALEDGKFKNLELLTSSSNNEDLLDLYEWYKLDKSQSVSRAILSKLKTQTEESLMGYYDELVTLVDSLKNQGHEYHKHALMVVNHLEYLLDGLCGTHATAMAEYYIEKLPYPFMVERIERYDTFIKDKGNKYLRM